MDLLQWVSSLTALTLAYRRNLLEIEMNFWRMDFLFLSSFDSPDIHPSNPSVLLFRAC